MKKFLLAFAVGYISTLAITNKTVAQTSSNLALLEPSKTAKSGANTFENSQSLSLSSVNTKAVNNFKKLYKTVANESWAKTREGFTARFESAGIQNMVYYNQKGRWSASLKTYDEDQLDKEVRRMVKQQYYDYQITAVQEIETLESNYQPTYIIYLASGKEIKLIRITNGEMDVYKEYTIQ